jgi:CheY-like chemotaxis protein
MRYIAGREAHMLRTRSVLIVDDDSDYRDALAEVLRGDGCAVFSAENGKQALEILSVIRPDLMIVDLVMPVMNGWDLCAALDHDRELADIPVAILSGVDRLAPFNQKHVLPKPLRIDTVVALLDMIDAPPPPSSAG